MKIDNIDALKIWLVNILNPIFEGDPDKLAQYIVALAKKVENDQPSKQRCINDLEVFLESSTHSFVDTLFDALFNKTYISADSSSLPNTSSDQSSAKPNEAESNTNTNTKTNTEDLSKKRDFSQPDRNPRRQNDNGSRSQHSRGRLSRDYQEIDVSSSNRPHRTSSSHGRRRKNRSRNRTHGISRSSSSSSSSPSPVRRSRSRSPYSRSRSRSPRLADDQGLDTSSKKARCRDFDEKGFCTAAELCPYDHGDVVIAPLIPPGQPSAIGSIQSHHQFNNQQQFNMQQRQQFGQKRRNISNPNQMNQMNQMNQNPTQRFMKHQQQQASFNNQRNIVGQANMGPQVSNLNPIGSESQMMFNPALQQQQQMQRQMVTNRPRNLVSIVTSIHEDDQTDLSNQQHRGIKRTYNSSSMKQPNSLNDPNNNLNNSFNNNNSMYDVNNEQYMNQQQQQQQQHQQAQTHQHAPQQQPNFMQNKNQQALLPTPNIMPQQQQQHQQQQQQNPKFHVSQYQQSPQTSNGNTQNRTLILRKIPNNLNNEDKMRQHFSKFGTILNIQCQYEQQTDAALIEFSSNKEAFAAYKCPQPVFNNRFIRLYWLSSYLKQQNQQGHQQQPQTAQAPQTDEPSLKRPAKERLSFTSQSETLQNEALNKENLIKPSTSLSSINLGAGGSLTKTVFNKDQTDATQPIGQEFSKSVDELSKKVSSTDLTNTTKNLAMAKQIQEENKRKTLLLKFEVQKKARELIEQQIRDQKILLKKFEQAKTVEEKNLILALVKKLSEAIEKEKEILSDNKKVGNVALSDQDGTKQSVDGSSSSTPSSPSIVANQSPFSFQKNPKTSFVIPPVHHLKLNNKRLNTTNFLKTSAAGSSIGKMTPHTKTMLAEAKAASNVSSAYSYSRVSVDNRPKLLLFTGVENSQEKGNIVNFINLVGCHVENVTEQTMAENTQISLIINFATRRDAEIALSKCSASLTSKKISITWYRQPESQLKPVVAELEVEAQKEELKEEEVKVDLAADKEAEPDKDKDNEEIQSESLINESVNDEQKSNVDDSMINLLANESDGKIESDESKKEEIGQVENEENSDVFDSLF